MKVTLTHAELQQAVNEYANSKTGLLFITETCTIDQGPYQAGGLISYKATIETEEPAKEATK